ncbi:MAG TPA: cache domain-containing protein, partial [Burkholderiales bacterium]|nr:cache domain-containing protein [Burkholderiales bacterium]
MKDENPPDRTAAPWRPGSVGSLVARGRAEAWRRVTSGGRWNAAIVLLALAFIGAIWIVTVERIGYERNETLESVTVQNSNLAIALEEHAVRTFKSASQALAQVARGHPGSGGLHDIADLVRAGAIDHSIFTVIGVADESGRPLHDSLISRSSADFTGLDFFESHRAGDTGKLFVGKPLLGPISGEWAIPVSRRINKPDGSFGGVAFAGIHPHYFTEFYRQTHLGVDGVMMLVGLDGIIRARQSWGTLGTFGQDLTGSMLLAEQGKATSGSYLSQGRGRIEAGRRYYSYRTLAQFPFVVAVGKG